MPRYRRAKVPGGTFFFAVTTYHRQRFLTDEDVRHALCEGIVLARNNHPFKILAWVLLPDHLHCIWELPPNDMDFSVRWAVIKRHVTRCCGERLKRDDLLTESAALRRGENTLWQRRFWEHQIRNDLDFQRHADYIHWNPVKHGYVTRAGDWSYSTFHQFVREGIYPPDWGLGCRDVGGEFGE